MNTDWEFWIDVGGTFTDCLAVKTNGTLRRHKLLSSGIYKLRFLAGSTAAAPLVKAPLHTPLDFFIGFEATAIDARGQACGAPVRVQGFNPGNGLLTLAEPLPIDSVHASGYLDLILELRSTEPAPVAGIRWLMGLSGTAPIGRVSVKLGTTKGTNALLERRGARVAVVLTKGFGDVLAIGYQNRPKLFALNIKKTSPLYESVIEADERLAADGTPLRALDGAALARDLAAVRARGIESLAICLLNSYKNSAHELRIEQLAREAGFTLISRSSAISPLQRLVPRAETVVVDAYLTPVIAGYVEELKRALPKAELKLMTSAGTLVKAERFVGKDSILSGPAGGVMGVMQVAREAGLTKVIGFDMGGTSTDVSRYDGVVERRFEMEVEADAVEGGAIRLVAPMLAIETVAAGGGSLCGFDGIRLTVGPASAGAVPGPACYGRGGPLTITDCNVALGRIVPQDFAFPLSPKASELRLNEQADAIGRALDRRPTIQELAEGYLALAASNMASPIKKVSLARGYDVREFALVSFGGAGAQHACQIADELGMQTIIQHPYASLLSAYGIGAAEERKFSARDVGTVISNKTLNDLGAGYAKMRGELVAAFSDEGIEPTRLTDETRLLDVRYTGQDSVITVPWSAAVNDVREQFEAMHRQQYGFAFSERPIEIRAARLELAVPANAPSSTARVELPSHEDKKNHQAYFDGTWRDVALYQRSALVGGHAVSGPALIAEHNTMIVVMRGWSAQLSPENHVVLTRQATGRSSTIDKTAKPLSLASDPIQLSLFTNRFASIAEQMGAALQRTALSVNVKERLDFSCAVFAPDGGLVVNAPHIPVHLGSMGDTVRSLLRDFSHEMRPGDVYITNDPYRGGSHLPDVTVITPVYSADGRTLLFFTGNRAHHAEIGGTTPGSMPPHSRTLAEEGVLIRAFRLVRGNLAGTAALRKLLVEAPYPSRRPDDNIEDIEAQTAANELGRQRLVELVERYSLKVVHAYMDHIRDGAARKMEMALRRLTPGVYRFSDDLDDGTRIAVAITIKQDKDGPGTASAICDFGGTSPPHPGNLNANPAITRAAVFYAFRCLINEEIPLNEGVLQRVELVIPSPSLLSPGSGDDPTKLAAVVGGNVETSQRLVDVLLGALGLAAASQGTMNNLLFGAERQGPSDADAGFGYYETICGGAGAGPGFNGASTVHTHMTNTRITDAEVIEERFPVRIRSFSIRHGSGGRGRYTGGDGVIRELEFLKPLTVSLITTRRLTQPYGLSGGKPGMSGRNSVWRALNNGWEELPGIALVELKAGDVLRLETPGGGGYGIPGER